MRGKGNKQRGQVLLMATLLSIPLFGMLGLVTDLGYMHYVKMTAQSAAEAAAQSAMVSFHKTNGGASYTCGATVVCASSETACPTNITTPADPIQDGCLYAQAHGFSSTGSVTYQTGLNSAPPTASGIGSAPYWVVYRTYQRVPQLFSAVLGNFSGLVVGRSTAAVVGATDCIYALDPNMAGAISVGGTAALTSSCGVLVDSNNACALSTNGSATITAPEYDVVGNVCTHAPLAPSANTGIAPASDPLAGLPVPATPTYECDFKNYDAKSGNITLQPGTYCGGISVENATVTFSAGTYILAGGGLSTQSANSVISGTNVFFYNTFGQTDKGNQAYGAININANSTVSLTAPATGAYAGILFFDDRSAPTGNPDNYGGGSTAVYQGVIYNPKNGVVMYGNSSTDTQYTMVVADYVTLQGTTAFNNNYTSLPGGVSPLQQVALVE
ncbi:MAG TPA: pilus assembly protein TadG-related protein [Bryobacteraceae bacterium]|nr:pilus assembly protein TadG-related protein [Bryobacteraceae bacterium]